MKAAFLDRDGTIVRDYPDEIWCTIDSPEFLEESLDALQLLKKKCYTIVIITNQYVIGEGYITQDDYERFSKKMTRTIADNGVEVLTTRYCSDKRSDPTNRLKPNAFMIDDVLRDYPDICLSESIFVGDAQSDAEMARQFGLRFFGIDMDLSGDNEISVRSLMEAAELA